MFNYQLLPALQQIFTRLTIALEENNEHIL